MLSAFANTLKVPELRNRILFTLAMVVIVRAGCSIVLPGVDAGVLREWVLQNQNNASNPFQAVAAILNVFSGGGLEKCAVFALGIMPYISASIMMQLLTAVVPKLNKMRREDGGYQKINQYTRLLTIALCVFQGYMLAKTLESPEHNPFLGNIKAVTDSFGPLVPHPGFFRFELMCVLVITAGALLLMWIGDQITEKGIGNGTSVIITVNIIADLPGAISQTWQTFVGSDNANSKVALLVPMIAFLLIVIAGVICITQAQRKIAVQYAKRVVGRKVHGGQTTFLPLKVNYSGVMPIIFAQAIIAFPAQIIQMAFGKYQWAQKLGYFLNHGWFYYTFSSLMIFFFSYFWVATMFQPTQIADDLKKNGGYIPGMRPGKPTADFLDYTMSRLTFAGALFLTLLFLIPSAISHWLKVPPKAAAFFGGTSILILVGVVLDMMRQMETHLVNSHYDGFLRKGKIRSRFDRAAATGVAPSIQKAGILWLYVALAVVLILGMAWFVYRQSTGVR